MAHKNDEAEETDLGNKRELERTGKPGRSQNHPEGKSAWEASAENAGTLVTAGTVPPPNAATAAARGTSQLSPISFLHFSFSREASCKDF